MTYLLLIIGFILLVKGADYLVEGASSIAANYNISGLIIGLTIVAFGTSTPELIVNILASASGNPEIAIGNILGSNIANILLILGISALIFPLTVKNSITWREIPFSMLAIVVLFLLVTGFNFELKSDTLILTRIGGVILILFFAFFMFYIIRSARNVNSSEDEIAPSKRSNKISTLYIVLGLAGLVVGGHLIVESASEIATNMGLSKSFIGLTVVAIGTSLPELATSAVAAFKRNTDIAIGNVVGSNIFNIFWILGVSSIITPLPLSPANIIDIFVAFISTVLLFIFVFTGKGRTINRVEGCIFVLLYVGYIIFLISNN